MPIESVNPATGETLKLYEEMTPQQTAAAVAQAHERVEGVEESDIRGTGNADEEGGGDPA